MATNQKDKSNQQADGKTQRDQTQGGKKNEVIDPNNPTAGQKNKQDSQESIQKNQDTLTTKSNTKLNSKSTEKSEKGTSVK